MATRCKLSDCYEFIGHPIEEATREIRKAMEEIGLENDIRFLDVGCGTGNIMLLARAVHLLDKPKTKKGRLAVCGIERRKELIPLAKTSARTTGDDEIYYCDAFEFKTIYHYGMIGIGGYSQFDIIYYYCPIQNSAIMAKLEEKIEDEMHVGAVLISNLKMSTRIKKDKRFKRIRFRTHRRNSMWKKIRA